MSKLITESVIEVQHWTDELFSFKTTRSPWFKFKNGHFTMIGIEQNGRPCMRAYSMVSPNYADYLEFYSIKVPDGELTSALKEISIGDPILVNTKSTGTLVTDHLLRGDRLYLLSTGTGIAPFLSIIQDIEVYDLFEKIILVHSVREVKDLNYQELITKTLPENEYFGDIVQNKLLYYPTVTREPYAHTQRITDLLKNNSIADEFNLPPIIPEEDRFMLCGSAFFIKDCKKVLEAKGFKEYHHGEPGHFVVERAFVDK